MLLGDARRATKGRLRFAEHDNSRAARGHKRTARVDKSKIYRNERGLESFLGDCFSSAAMSVRAAGGTPTAPLRTISVAPIFLPYTSSLALLSGRSVDPSSDTPANNPRVR